MTKRTRHWRLNFRVISIVLVGAVFAWPVVTTSQTGQIPLPVFLLEIPGFGVSPTDQSEIVIPSSSAPELRIHVQNPYAELIDYSQIFTFVNREAAATVSEITAGERGKLVRVRLDVRNDIHLLQGRNTIEVEARNRRGRLYYASFVLRTATENRNLYLPYKIALGGDKSLQTPPELMLFTPERAVERRGRSALRVQVAGIATASTSVKRITINGGPVALKRGGQIVGRGLGIAFEANRVEFDTTVIVNSSTLEIVIEAVDASDNRTRLTVPVTEGDPNPPARLKGKKYALIIGISRYQYHDDRLPNLQYADSDAKAVFQFLRSPAGGRFSVDEMLLLTNEQATLGRIREALSSFILRPGPDDLLLIFLASHGSPDPFALQKLYFLTHDTQVDRMADTALAMKDVEMLIQQSLRVKRLVLLIDTCHSAGLTETPRALRQPNNLISLYAERLLYAAEGRSVMTSSDVNETAFEGQKWGGGHGVFSHFVLQGLHGKADIDGDKVVTVGELFRFVRQNVRLETQFRQNPRVMTSTNDDLALAAVPERVR